MITQAADFFISGCGRCSKFDTPECKVHRWRSQLTRLREIALECGLTEEAKWGHPVYTFQQKNIVMIGAFKEFCVLSFFKGTLLEDKHRILSAHGDNSQSVLGVRFVAGDEVEPLGDIMKDYIFEAIEVEKAGLKPQLKKIDEYEIPEELQRKMDENPAFKAAFQALTPGRQRGYLLHFSAPKQAKTREARIEKCMPAIFQGKGMND